MRDAVLLVAVILLAACGSIGAGVAPSPTYRSDTGIFVSDIHFNPLADPVLANSIAQAPVSQWDAIFSTSTIKTYSPYFRDTNFLLLQSALTAMHQRVPSPDVVIVSGDSLAHDLSAIYNATVTRPPPSGYAAFVNATEQYVAMKLSQTFPYAQIIPALGDWDTACGVDSFAGYGFLASYSAVWNAAVDRYGGSPDFRTSFAGGGYYTTAFPIDPRGVMIVVNTQPWSKGYTAGCGGTDGDLGKTELGWLTNQLSAARAQGRRVWILGHIPPGIAPPQGGGPSCPASIEPFYADTYAGPLYGIFNDYRDGLAFGIFGHEHMDDYRLARDTFGNPIFGMKMIPSITPLDSNNPAFVIFTYNPGAGIISDASTWYLTNLSSATSAAPGVWGDEYDFGLTYGQTSFDTRGITGAIEQMRAQPDPQAAFQHYFMSSAGTGATPFLPYSCGFDNLTVANYTVCACGP